jgi:1-aminocyclopropane-1-carboxylate deaminase/D-cysteine desulfhydrase-like pyridoxal-dependent ACC family enzyme
MVVISFKFTLSKKVPQGGACGMAAGGAKLLAGEIASFWSENGQGRPLSVIIPGGTCSTAVLVHHGLQNLLRDRDDSEKPMDIRVAVIPCVGDDAYARRQMMSLSLQLGESADDIPTVLAPAPEESLMTKGPAETDYFSFGEPKKEILDTFQMMKEDHGVVLDLLYGASAWTILLRHWDSQLGADLSFDPNNPIAGREIMYVHSGGLEGINSQLLRYKYKGLVADEDIQLPGRDRRSP